MPESGLGIALEAEVQDQDGVRLWMTVTETVVPTGVDESAGAWEHHDGDERNIQSFQTAFLVVMRSLVPPREASQDCL